MKRQSFKVVSRHQLVFRSLVRYTINSFSNTLQHVLFCFSVFYFDILGYPEAEGKATEAEINKTGPGEAFFIFCDVTKEDDVKVGIIIHNPDVM